MIEYEINPESRIVIVRPKSRLSVEDFQGLAASVDQFLESRSELAGLLIQMEVFPGWEDFSGLLQHLKFVKGHHQKIRKVAFVTDSRIADLAPHLAKHFISAEVRAFAFEAFDEAQSWLESADEAGSEET